LPLSQFTPKEVALGLVVYCAGLLAAGFATLVSMVFRSHYALPVSLGFLGTATVVIFTMILWLGLRGAFDSFDVIRRFKP
jgi:mannose/fructose/N-acetylgalactosamine-specific phosphotransferase system component IIC